MFNVGERCNIMAIVIVEVFVQNHRWFREKARESVHGITGRIRDA
jgi:hypothetical protein